MDPLAQTGQRGEYAVVALAWRPVVGDILDGADQCLMVGTERDVRQLHAAALGEAHQLQHAGGVDAVDPGGIQLVDRVRQRAQLLGHLQRAGQRPVAAQPDPAGFGGIGFAVRAGKGGGHGIARPRSIQAIPLNVRTTPMNARLPSGSRNQSAASTTTNTEADSLRIAATEAEVNL